MFFSCLSLFISVRPIQHMILFPKFIVINVKFALIKIRILATICSFSYFLLQDLKAAIVEKKTRIDQHTKCLKLLKAKLPLHAHSSVIQFYEIRTSFVFGLMKLPVPSVYIPIFTILTLTVPEK